jgi:hypothetical protein
MADFKIKSAAGTGNKTLIQSENQIDSNYAIQIGAGGASTLHDPTYPFYGVQARLSTQSGSITSHNAWNEVGSNQAQFGTGKWTTEKINGGTFSNDTGRFTATKAGFYLITGSFDWGRLDDGQTLFTLLSKNGSYDTSSTLVRAFERQMGSTSNNAMAISLSGTVELNGTSDYVSMFWNSSNTVNTYVKVGTRLSCTYIGT